MGHISDSSKRESYSPTGFSSIQVETLQLLQYAVPLLSSPGHDAGEGLYD